MELQSWSLAQRPRGWVRRLGAAVGVSWYILLGRDLKWGRKWAAGSGSEGKETLSGVLELT